MQDMLSTLQENIPEALDIIQQMEQRVADGTAALELRAVSKASINILSDEILQFNSARVFVLIEFAKIKTRLRGTLGQMKTLNMKACSGILGVDFPVSSDVIDDVNMLCSGYLPNSLFGSELVRTSDKMSIASEWINHVLKRNYYLRKCLSGSHEEEDHRSICYPLSLLVDPGKLLRTVMPLVIDRNEWPITVWQISICGDDDPGNGTTPSFSGLYLRGNAFWNQTGACLLFSDSSEFHAGAKNLPRLSLHSPMLHEEFVRTRSKHLIADVEEDQEEQEKKGKVETTTTTTTTTLQQQEVEAQQTTDIGTSSPEFVDRKEKEDRDDRCGLVCPVCCAGGAGGVITYIFIPSSSTRSHIKVYQGEETIKVYC